MVVGGGGWLGLDRAPLVPYLEVLRSVRPRTGYRVRHDRQVAGFLEEYMMYRPAGAGKIGYFVILQHPQLPGWLRSAARRTPSGLWNPRNHQNPMISYGFSTSVYDLTRHYIHTYGPRI